MDRRSALLGMLFLASAPAIIKIDILMKLKPIMPTISYDTVKVNCQGYTVADLYKYLQHIWDGDTQMDIDFPLMKKNVMVEVQSPQSYQIIGHLNAVVNG